MLRQYKIYLTGKVQLFFWGNTQQLQRKWRKINFIWVHKSNNTSNAGYSGSGAQLIDTFCAERQHLWGEIVRGNIRMQVIKVHLEIVEVERSDGILSLREVKAD